MLAYLLERGKEASTWRGLVALLTAVGVSLEPNQMEAIVALGLAVIGAIGVFLADKK
jgi:ribosomal protein L12E/L44/L45/RPP1/RPP2